MLPDTIDGLNAPVVATKTQDTGGEAHDFSSYLVPLGTADIFFPTDFDYIQHMYTKVTGKDAEVYTHRAFLEAYADASKCQTKDKKYNPLLDDYANMRFMITSSGQNK